MIISKELKEFLINNQELLNDELEIFYKTANKKLEPFSLAELTGLLIKANFNNIPKKFLFFNKIIGNTGNFIGFDDYNEYDEEETEIFQSMEDKHGTITNCNSDDGYKAEYSDEENYERCYWTITFDDGNELGGIGGKTIELDNPIE